MTSSPAAPRAPAPEFDPLSLSAEMVARVVACWRALCEDERDSMIAATLVAGDLARLGAPPPILAAAARVIEDEVRHVGVCQTVLERLGAEAAEIPADQRRRGVGDNPSIERRTAAALVAGFGVGESMSAGCFAAARRSCRHPLMRWALTELLRDEARHGGFGIDAGRWLIRILVGRRTPRALARMCHRDGSVRATRRRSRIAQRRVDTERRGAGCRHSQPP